MSVIEYDIYKTARRDFDSEVRRRIAETNVMRICEIGGGANPDIRPAELNEANVEYTLLDISSEELHKAPECYKKLEVDITKPNSKVESCGKYDLAISKMLAEHVLDAECFHKNTYKLLRAGGVVLHLFPTLYAFPFVANKLFPEQISYRILNTIAPRDSWKEKKFPAYYKMCRGPTRRSIKRYERLGYKVLLYRSYFGHGYYDRIPILQQLSKLFAKVLLRLPIPS